MGARHAGLSHLDRRFGAVVMTRHEWFRPARVSGERRREPSFRLAHARAALRLDPVFGLVVLQHLRPGEPDPAHHQVHVVVRRVAMDGSDPAQASDAHLGLKAADRRSRKALEIQAWSGLG